MSLIITPAIIEAGARFIAETHAACSMLIDSGEREHELVEISVWRTRLRESRRRSSAGASRRTVRSVW